VKSLILGQRALKPSNIASYRDITEKKEQEMSWTLNTNKKVENPANIISGGRGIL
jgi:hypothetical protein